MLAAASPFLPSSSLTRSPLRRPGSADIYKVIYSRKSQKQKLEPLKTAKAAQDYKART